MARRLALVLPCSLALACGPPKSSSTSADSATDSSESDDSDTSVTTDEPPTETDETDDESDTGLTFIPDDDFPCSVKLSLCDTFAQDCPDGEKCTPIDAANSTCGVDVACVPILGDKHAGEACNAETEPIEDDCDGQSWCYARNIGLPAPSVCIEFCGGTADNPSCTNPDEVCVFGHEFYQGALGCRPRCDPLGPDVCLEGERCTLGPGQTDFACVLASAELQSGEPCSFSHECDAGLCVEAVDLPSCADERCCASVCDVLAPDCPDDGSECVAVELPDDPETTIGVCRLPD